MFTLYMIENLFHQRKYRMEIAQLSKDITNLMNGRYTPDHNSFLYMFSEFTYNDLSSSILDIVKRKSNIQNYIDPTSTELYITDGKITNEGDRTVIDVLRSSTFDILMKISQLPVKNRVYIDRDGHNNFSNRITDLRQAAYEYGKKMGVVNVDIPYNTIDNSQRLMTVMTSLIDNSNYQSFGENMSLLISDAIQAFRTSHYDIYLNGEPIDKMYLNELVKTGVWTLASMYITYRDLIKEEDSIILKIVHLLKEKNEKIDAKKEFKWFCDHAGIPFPVNLNASMQPYLLDINVDNHNETTILYEFDKSFNNFKARSIFSMTTFLPYHTIIDSQYRHQIKSNEECIVLFAFPIFIYRILINQRWINESVDYPDGYDFIHIDYEDQHENIIHINTFNRLLDSVNEFELKDSSDVVDSIKPSILVLENIPIYAINGTNYAFFDDRWRVIEKKSKDKLTTKTLLVPSDEALAQILQEDFDIADIIDTKKRINFKSIPLKKRTFAMRKLVPSKSIKLTKIPLNDKNRHVSKYCVDIKGDKVYLVRVNSSHVRVYEESGINRKQVITSQGEYKYINIEQVYDTKELINKLIDQHITNKTLWNAVYMFEFANTYFRYLSDDPTMHIDTNADLEKILTETAAMPIIKFIEKLLAIYAISRDVDIGERSTKMQSLNRLINAIKFVGNMKNLDDKSIGPFGTTIVRGYPSKGRDDKIDVKTCPEYAIAEALFNDRKKYINECTMSEDIGDVISDYYGRELLNQINSVKQNVLFDVGKINPEYEPQEIPFADKLELNRSYAMLNEIVESTSFRHDGYIDCNPLRDHAEGRIFFDIEDIPTDGHHEWADAKFYMAQLISVLSWIYAGDDAKKRDKFTEEMIKSFVITNNTASSHGFSYHFYLPLNVMYKCMIAVLNSQFITKLRNDYEENVFRYLDPLVYLDDIVNIRLMYYNKGSNVFKLRKGTRSDVSMKYISDVDRLIIGDPETVKNRVMNILDHSEEIMAFMHDMIGLEGEIKKTDFNNDTIIDLIIKFIKKAVTEPTYLILANAFGLLNGKGQILVSSKGNNYHSFYQAGKWMIEHAGKNVVELIKQTSIGYTKDITNKNLMEFMPVKDDLTIARMVARIDADIDNGIKSYIDPFLFYIDVNGNKTWRGVVQEGTYEYKLRDALDKAFE